MAKTKQEYIVLIEKGMSSRQIAKQFKIGQTTARYYINKYGLKTNPHINKQSTVCLCSICGQNRLQQFYSRKSGRKVKSICKKCHNKDRQARIYNNKEKAVEYKGGKCSRCQCAFKDIEVYDFHHMNPKQKQMTWNQMRMKKWQKIKQELDKCELLCSNCHRQTHDCEARYKNQKTVFRKNRLKNKEDFAALLGGKCAECGYDKCFAALDFHHKDPSKKDMVIGDSNWNRQIVQEQIRKCELLCANCHRLQHKRLRNNDI